MGSKLNSKNFKVGIIIPAFNPNNQCLNELNNRLINVVKRYNYQIVIIDDGSSPEISLDNTHGKNIKILRHDRNIGKGAALRSGFKYFIVDQPCDFIITLDSDLQHPPEIIPSLIKACREGKGDLIIGYRKREPSKMPIHRILSNILTSLVISLLIGQLIRDSQCGYRLIKYSVLKRIALKEQGFQLESELIIRVGWNKKKIGFVEIPTIYNKEKSSINNIYDTLNFMLMIFDLCKERIFHYVRAT